MINKHIVFFLSKSLFSVSSYCSQAEHARRWRFNRPHRQLFNYTFTQCLDCVAAELYPFPVRVCCFAINTFLAIHPSFVTSSLSTIMYAVDSIR